MFKYTAQERAKIVKIFISNNSSVRATQREFQRLFPNRPPPIPQTIRRLAKQYAETGSTLDNPRSGRPRTSRSLENIDAVRESLLDAPEISARKRAKQLGLSRRSLFRILTEDLSLLSHTTSAEFVSKNKFKHKIKICPGKKIKKQTGETKEFQQDFAANSVEEETIIPEQDPLSDAHPAFVIKDEKM